jgi:hypothetical protein
LQNVVQFSSLADKTVPSGQNLGKMTKGDGQKGNGQYGKGKIPILPWEYVILLLVILTCGTFLHQLTHLGYGKRNLCTTSSMLPDGAPIMPT